MSLKRFLAGAAMALGLAAGYAPGAAQAGQTFDAIKARGSLVCGINVGVAGFSLPDSQGVWRGMDADLCRGLAAAIFSDPAKVRFVPLSSLQRFTALAIRRDRRAVPPDTLTMTRDTTLGLRMVTVYLYDGHGFMVRKDANISDPKGMDGTTICLSPGTTNEQVTADWFRAQHALHPAAAGTHAGNATALQAGRCDASARMPRSSRRCAASSSSRAISSSCRSASARSPTAPMVRRDDQQWFDVVRWTSGPDPGGGAGRHQRQCRGDEAQQPEPEYPPPAWAPIRSSAMR